MLKFYEIENNDQYFFDEQLNYYLNECNISLYGNRDYIEHMSDELKSVYDLLDNDMNEYDFTGYAYYDSIKEMIEDLTDFDISHLTNDDYKRLKQLNKDYFDRQKEDNAVIEVFNLLSGQNTTISILRGCGQSDWVYCHHDINFDVTHLQDFYFNMGTNYYNECEDVQIYVPHYEDVKLYMKDYYKDDDTKVYNISGYTQIPQYEEVV